MKDHKIMTDNFQAMKHYMKWQLEEQREEYLFYTILSFAVGATLGIFVILFVLPIR